jgi:hypothetical protein
MEPSEALGIAAQIAVALAGFAGVVVVFRGESVHEWSPLDKFRLRLLLANSILPLGLCVIALLLLTIQPELPAVWRWCSAVAFVVFLLFGVTTVASFRRHGLRKVQGGPGNFIFYVFGGLGIGAIVLQLVNIALLVTFWPFFAGMDLQLLAAMLQFARMILWPPE